MEEQFEKFSRDNKKDFDYLEVPSELWDKIETKRKAPKIKKSNLFSTKYIFKQVASIALIATVSILAYKWISEKPTETSKQITEVIADEVIPNELEDLDQYYGREVDKAMVHFTSSIPNQHEIFIEIKAQLNYLDDERGMLVNEFSANYDKNIMEEIINIYRLKIEILEDAVASHKATKE